MYIQIYSRYLYDSVINRLIIIRSKAPNRRIKRARAQARRRRPKEARGPLGGSRQSLRAYFARDAGPLFGTRLQATTAPPPYTRQYNPGNRCVTNKRFSCRD